MQMPYFGMTVVAILALLPVCASADVYRCVGTDGKILYSDSPCPHGATQKSNITTAVGACTTAECETKRQQEAYDAREQLRAQKEELAELTDRRRRYELEAERARVELEEVRWRSAADARLAAAEEAAHAGVYYPAYPYARGIKSCGPRCNDLRPRPPHASQPLPRQERVARLRTNPVIAGSRRYP